MIVAFFGYKGYTMGIQGAHRDQQKLALEYPAARRYSGGGATGVEPIFGGRTMGAT